MKLVFAIKNLSGAAGGAERVLCTVCSMLAERGHNVTIVTFDRAGGSPFYHLHSTVGRIDLGIGDATHSARFKESVIRIKALRKVVQDARPDIAIGFMHSMFVPLAFAMIGTGIPVIGSEHVVPKHYRTRPGQYLLLAASTFFIKKITVLSEKIRLSYPRIVGDRMVVLSNPVERATGSSYSQVGRMNRRLLCVGRLEIEKAHDILLKAYAQVARQFPEWELIVFGEGSQRWKLQRLLSALGIQGRVKFPGLVSNIFAEYERSDIFVIPSQYEAFGLATAEAMMHGLPVIGFADCSGTNELIEHDRTGLLVEPEGNRVEALAHALQILMRDQVLRERLGKEARARLEKKYSVSAVVDQWEILINSCCARNTKSDAVQV